MLLVVFYRIQYPVQQRGWSQRGDQEDSFVSCPMLYMFTSSFIVLLLLKAILIRSGINARLPEAEKGAGYCTFSGNNTCRTDSRLCTVSAVFCGPDAWQRAAMHCARLTCAALPASSALPAKQALTQQSAVAWVTTCFKLLLLTKYLASVEKD